MIAVLVECYSGSRYAERPVAVYWRGQRLEIRQVVSRWRTPNGPGFDVVTAGDLRLILELDETADCWSAAEYHPSMYTGQQIGPVTEDRTDPGQQDDRSGLP